MPFLTIILISIQGFVMQDHSSQPTTAKEAPSFPWEAERDQLPPDGGPKYNRLVFESSPYLLQHATNPVDWYPWGEAAFEKARKEDKPIFLSIGYATCHWCHVMEHESFEDKMVANQLNETFVCIKVDKEERPDIDDLYMTACMAMTGHGGWPLTVMLTHDKKPFFAGTYFPKNSRPGRIGVLELAERIQDLWANRREDLIANADQLTKHLQQAGAATPGGELDENTLKRAFSQLNTRYDVQYGGFGDSPKFPTPHNFLFLLRYWKRTGDGKALGIVAHTLSEMRRGGVFDHIGLGFHRYSTDAEWLLPHFEKMLYDQALLAIAYTETAQATGDPFFAKVAREIFTYVLRDMTSPEGGFYSAEDADSEGEEGTFYVWKAKEIKSILGDEDGERFCRLFNFVKGGNFVEEATGLKTGDNIPHLNQDPRKLSFDGLSGEALHNFIEASRKKLYEVREKRIHPLKDDKILTDWNGLMIAAFAIGARSLQQPGYALAAQRAADFVLTSLRLENGDLVKRYRKGDAGLPAHLDDYAFLTWGLIELYQAVHNTKYLQAAIELVKTADREFLDTKTGAYYLTSLDNKDLFTRSMRIYDGAIPSGNSVMAGNLVRLSRITGDTSYEERAAKIMTAFSGQVSSSPTMSTQLMCALDFMLGPSHEIVIAGDKDQTAAMFTAVNSIYLPNKVLLHRDGGDALPKLAPYTSAQKTINGKATAYVCKNFACERPTNDIQVMLKALGKGSGPR